MNEFDAVKGILLEKLSCPEEHLQAIKAETNKNWKEAQEAYEELILNDTESQYRKELYYESYFKCFASLADWENLSKNVEVSVCGEVQSNPWDKLWDQDWYQKKVMPWYLKSEVRNILHDPVRANTLMRNINECFQDSEKYEYLKTNFCEELAILWLVNGDEDEAKLFLRTSLSQFLEKWSSLGTLNSKSRYVKLLNMKNVIDIDVFIKQLSKLSSINFEEITTFLKKMFTMNANDVAADLQIFETRILHHQRFVVMLAEKLKHLINFDIELDEITTDLNGIKYQLNNSLVEAGLQQSNFYVARKYFLYQQKLAANSDLNIKLLKSRIGFLNAKSSGGTPKTKLLLDCWEYIGKY